ncbi:hypothetical protein CEV31_4420 [Brucella thiophenivorans]|uniref:Uncharacterized protein n=1 Tax=Brucella thiophenivorans TaxID=571255 RepID=A0A256FN55_9HYPH|nr:hypothetical protein CEV31_4420 [Brucella thiophenivorans]
MCYSDRAAIKWFRELSSDVIRIRLMKIEHVFWGKSLSAPHVDRSEVV